MQNDRDKCVTFTTHAETIPSTNKHQLHHATHRHTHQRHALMHFHLGMTNDSRLSISICGK